ncbi:2-dehydro-3-deoxygalactonokinase [Palleronia sp.]|uniref:2-dehydro-3-deoxygalactonokinase n=1 Tax=Palleronia sp. TaxID=1940284 RepID=UPI0035C7B16A
MKPDWIALDWGTTNVRAWAMSAGGAVLAEAQSAAGMGSLGADDYAPALAALTEGWDLPQPCPVLACGMIGAREGWAEAGYAAVPTAPLATPPVRVPTAPEQWRVRIIPGLSQTRPPDVMRGEETQIAGFLALNPKFDGTLCLPGSHTKWAQISAGEVISFQTAMTGEIFAALKGHTVLRHAIGAEWDEASFVEAVSDGMSRPEALAARAFQIRADGLLNGKDEATAAARLSGLLIGAELAHARPYWLGMPVAIVGAPQLGLRYAAALEAQGVRAIIAKGDACTLAGLKTAYAAWKE